MALLSARTFCSLAAACLAAKRFPPANTTLPAFCLGAEAAAAAAAGVAPLLDEALPGAAPPAGLEPEAAQNMSKLCATIKKPVCDSHLKCVCTDHMMTVT